MKKRIWYLCYQDRPFDGAELASIDATIELSATDENGALKEGRTLWIERKSRGFKRHPIYRKRFPNSPRIRLEISL